MIVCSIRLDIYYTLQDKLNGVRDQLEERRGFGRSGSKAFGGFEGKQGQKADYCLWKGRTFFM